MTTKTKKTPAAVKTAVTPAMQAAWEATGKKPVVKKAKAPKPPMDEEDDDSRALETEMNDLSPDHGDREW